MVHWIGVDLQFVGEVSCSCYVEVVLDGTLDDLLLSCGDLVIAEGELHAEGVATACV